MNPKWCMKKETVKKTVSIRSFFSMHQSGPQNNFSIWRKNSSNTNSYFSHFWFIHLDNYGFEIDAKLQKTNVLSLSKHEFDVQRIEFNMNLQWCMKKETLKKLLLHSSFFHA